LLEDRTLDGIVVAVWPRTQAEVIEAAIDAGHRHILCQPPLATDLASAQRILSLARRTGTFVRVAHAFENHPAFRQIGRLRRTSALGDLDEIRISNTTFSPDNGPSFEVRQGWRHDKNRGAGVENELLQAPLYAANRLADGKAMSAFATGRMSGVSDSWLSVQAVVNFDTGLSASIRCSKLAVREQEIRLAFRNGSLSLNEAFSMADEAELVETRAGTWGERVRAVRPVEPIDPETRLLEIFGRDAVGASPMEDTLDASLVDVAVTQALLTSLESGKLEPVPRTHSLYLAGPSSKAA
jgi:predicted dehydrogenase